MLHCPSEIWSEICAFACTDDGRTGRSLSLASRFLHEISKPFKLQSIAVVGYLQLSAFADLVEKTPVQYRHVQCIFFSANSRQTSSDATILILEYAQRKEVYATVERILRAIAGYVKIIHAFFVFYRPFILLPVSLPALEELTIHGCLETSADHNINIQFESLKHLNMTSSCPPSYILDKVLKVTPSLTHLALCASERSDRVLNEWSSIATNREVGFPRHLEKICIYSPIRPNGEFVESLRLYDGIMSALCSLGKADPRVSLLPPRQHDLFRMITFGEAIAIWKASIYWQE